MKRKTCKPICQPGGKIEPATWYRVTRLFTNGTLKGLEYTETTSVKFKEGKKYKACAGSDYKITKVEAL